MTRTENAWNAQLQDLITQIWASERAYGTLVQSDRYPRFRPFFNKRYFKQQHSRLILDEEFEVIEGRKAKESSPNNNLIFSSVENRLLEDKMTDREIDALIIRSEEELLLKYQQVLAHPELPNVTDALLQSQAEEGNNMLQGLRTDYQINHKRPVPENV
ncbi:hypothetical protein [Pricia sp.]|uniref:hypothetical protein n=1 Tax=Pricia sp. TaxID=2268138 RepID=UPI003593B849